ncbi:MAG TPA: hypothetical protein VGJ60_16655 [Chloroflexota bacterium]|jgi:hypothetical protein
MTVPPFPTGLDARLEHFINHGSSLMLNWGEDTGCWEFEWISSGQRFRAVSRKLHIALQQVDALARGTLAPREQP